ncbi:MAG: hypothetical protein J5I47_01915 [Vicingus serpentipes]|nr:hypothetical protein [Vicingus serpentipes]
MNLEEIIFNKELCDILRDIVINSPLSLNEAYTYMLPAIKFLKGRPLKRTHSYVAKN